MSMKLVELSDSQLYRLCQEYGIRARLWKRKFVGLLSEVYRRHLYKRRGYGSIYEFASKLGGVSQESVDRILRLAERIDDKPALKNLLETGAHGWTKIEAVSYLATTENEKDLAEKVFTMSQSSLQIFVQEVRKTASKSVFEDNSQYELQMTQDSQMEELEQWQRMSFPVSPDVLRALYFLKQALEKKSKQTLTWNDVMKFFLRKNGVGLGNGGNVAAGSMIFSGASTAGDVSQAPANPQIYSTTQKSFKIVEICSNCVTEKMQQCDEAKRHIPLDVQRIIFAKYGMQCVFPKCLHPYDHLHHTKRFSLVRDHDPNFIVPLCQRHHVFVHTGFLENEEAEPHLWKIRFRPDYFSPKYFIDRKFMQRMASFGTARNSRSSAP